MASLRSTSMTPALSHDRKAPICAAQTSGPVPPGPAPRISVSSMTRPPSPQYLKKDAANLLDDVVVDGIRGGQIDADLRQRGAVATRPRIALVGGQCRQR